MQVIPAHAPEQLKPIPNTRTRTFFIVKAQLDEVALRNAFDQLIRQHWRMLGARIVKNPKAGYEYHLPESFDDDYELFKWSSSKVDTSLEEALPWIEAPKSDGISLLPPVAEADRLLRPESWPFELKDDPKDGPQFYIHLTFFDNATVLAISMPHLLADQLGLANLLKAWLGLAAGRDPPAYIHDVIPEDARYEDYSEEERYRKGWFRVRRRFERFLVILGFMPDFILKPTEQPSILFLPKSTIDQLRKRFAKELEAKYGQDPKVTNGDVLTAIAAKLSRFSDKKPQWLTLTQSMNARNRLPELSGDKMDGYIGSALFFGSSRFCLDPSTTRLSDIAFANRKAIEEALDPGLIRMQFAIHREMVKRGQPIHVCEPWEYSFSVTSWTSAWQGIDFGSVVQGGRTSEPPEFQVLGGSGERGIPGRFHTCIMGKAQGGYWMDFHSEIGNYNAIKAYLAQDPKLESL